MEGLEKWNTAMVTARSFFSYSLDRVDPVMVGSDAVLCSICNSNACNYKTWTIGRLESDEGAVIRENAMVRDEEKVKNRTKCKGFPWIYK